MALLVPAHIAGIPVEEWLPFVAPVVALYVFGRRRDRRRRAEVESLPPATELLDEPTVERVLERWRRGRHGDLAARHLAIMYPPGPDGATVGAIAAGAELPAVEAERLLTELADLGYVELEGEDGEHQGVSLTVEGHDVMNLAEQELLASARGRAGEHQHAAQAAP